MHASAGRRLRTGMGIRCMIRSITSRPSIDQWSGQARKARSTALPCNTSEALKPARVHLIEGLALSRLFSPTAPPPALEAKHLCFLLRLRLRRADASASSIFAFSAFTCFCSATTGQWLLCNSWTHRTIISLSSTIAGANSNDVRIVEVIYDHAHREFYIARIERAHHADDTRLRVMVHVRTILPFMVVHVVLCQRIFTL